MAFQPTLSKFGVPLVPGTSGVGILQPKLKYRFRVSMYNFGPSGAALNLTHQVKSVGRPKIDHGRQELHSYNNIMYIPTKPSWQTIQLTVTDDITNSVSGLVSAQIQKQMNHFDQTSAVAGINYKFMTQIETLDGGDTNTLENWYLEGCYIQDAEFDSFDYSASDPIMITMTLSFDNATQDNTIMPQEQAITTPGSNAG